MVLAYALILVLATLPTSSFGSTVRPGDIFVANGGNSSVLRIDPDSGEQFIVASGNLLRSPSDIVIDESGDLLVTDAVASSLVRVNPTSGKQTLIASGGDLLGPLALARGPDDLVYVAAVTGGLIAVDIATGDQRLLPAPLVRNIRGLAFQEPGLLFLTSSTLQSVSRLNLETLEVSVVTSGQLLEAPIGLVETSSGDLLVADSFGSVVQVDPANGEQTLLARSAEALGIVDLAIDDDGRFVLSAGAGPGVFRSDAETGGVDLISDSGPLSLPSGVAIAVRMVPEPVAVVSLAAAAALLRPRRLRHLPPQRAARPPGGEDRRGSS